jgi:hypothetical protein
MIDLDTQETNDKCQACRRNDAAILDDAGTAYCPQCWFVRCESAIGGTRTRARRPGEVYLSLVVTAGMDGG